MRSQTVKSSLNNDNTAATVTIGGNKVGTITIFGIHAGYTVAPASPTRMTVTVDGVIKWAQPMTNAGPAPFVFGDYGWMIESNGTTGVVITLPAAGTAGTIGDLNVIVRA